LRRYGHDDAALRIVTGIAEAAMHFHHYRLPEVFAGFPRESYQVPVHYPVACHPQAWAAGTVPYLLSTDGAKVQVLQTTGPLEVQIET
jgi:glycogen debranching enzyme